LTFILVNSTSKSGVVGNHTFTIEAAGLREQTEANDTLNYWSAIKKVEKARAAIYVQINPWLFYVLPRRSFGSDQRFNAFFEALVTHQKGSAA
jgi:YcxB-like protein